ncbi:hypothetical protein ACWDWO_05130 [Actinopolymorpha singaporensis]
MSSGQFGRRAFLRRCGTSAMVLGAAGVGAVGVPALTPTPRALAATPSAYDYTTRATYDTFDRAFHESGSSGQPDQPNEAGGLAWGQSYVLASFLRMYDAYRDTYYLDRFVHNADLVLANRDSERGVTDYAGRSRPAWRTTNPYTVGIARLSDAGGAPVLEVRSALAYADRATATVRAGEGGRFTLSVTNAQYGRTDTFADVTMDPAGPDYVVDRVYDAYPTGTMVTVRDLRPAPAAGDPPAPGDTALASAPLVFAVHTGMISYPLAWFAATVLTDPRLCRDPRYARKAEEYAAAARDAAAVHDEEWRDGPDGTGWFQWPKGMPVPYDGNIQPINQSVALGRTYLALAEVTRDRTYRDRASRLARMFATQLEVDSRGAATWHYWPTTSRMYDGYAKTGNPATDVSIYTPAYGSAGRGAQQYEDVSHGAIEVDFAVRAFRSGVVFRGADMAAFAATYTRNLATTTPDGIATTYTRVDGGGGLAASGQYLQAPRWMAVAWWDERVFTNARAIYDDRQVQPGFGSGLLCVANLNWYARRG